MTLTARSDEQVEWEARTGWVESEKGANRHPVRWITGTRERRDDSWPMLSAWDHAFPVEHRDTGEHAYLLMPYGVMPSAAKQLTDWCEEQGVRWESMGEVGWWHPRSVAVLVRCDHE